MTGSYQTTVGTAASVGVMSDEWLSGRVTEILRRRPAVGMAVSVVNEADTCFSGHGLADIDSNTPVSADTIFRIGSITKTMTAIAVMQLCERGLVDLDEPAADHLTAFTLVPARGRWRPVTVRHLLTHTSGIPDVIYIGHLLHRSWGPFEGRPPLLSVEIGERLPSLAEYYRQGIEIVDEPGTTFAYSNHGFAVLGQIIEEVAGRPLDVYFRQHIFEPLGMEHTDLKRSAPVEVRLARGYELGRRGPRAITDREWIGAAGGGVYSSSGDMVRYVKALLGAGSNENGSVIDPNTFEEMLGYHYRPDPRLPGIGLGFFRREAAGRRFVGHDGILPGFNSSLLIAPDDGVGVVAFTNGSRGAMAWLPAETERLLSDLVGVDCDTANRDAVHHPEVWPRLCGRYRLPRVGDLRGRLALGAGVEVHVANGRLVVRLLTPVPALYRGFPLLPDDPGDPHVFRADLSRIGMAPVRLIFSSEADGRRVIHTDLGGQPLTLYESKPKASS